MNSIFVTISMALLFYSCQAIIESVQGTHPSKVKTVKDRKDITCKKSQAIQYMSEDHLHTESFRKFIKKLRSEYPLQEVDIFILYTLAQLNLRPDIASPSSQLILAVKRKGQVFYQHFFSTDKEQTFPLFYALERTLKQFKSTYKLSKLIYFIDRQKFMTYRVSPELEKALSAQSSLVAASPILKNKYFKGVDILKEQEQMRQIPLAPLYRVYLKDKRKRSYRMDERLFKHQDSKVSSFCNYDLKLYQNSIYVIHQKEISSHQFGLKTAKNVFMATLNQDYSKVEALEGSAFFKGRSDGRFSGFCHFRFPNNQTLITMASKSRDPGQHLYHLTEYGVTKIHKLEDLVKLFKFSRHLFLEDPLRLIFESGRSSREQLQEVLKLDIPIYHAEKLGDIVGYFENNQEKSLFIDPRNRGSLICVDN